MGHIVSDAVVTKLLSAPQCSEVVASLKRHTQSTDLLYKSHRPQIPSSPKKEMDLRNMKSEICGENSYRVCMDWQHIAREKKVLRLHGRLNGGVMAGINTKP